MISAEEIKALMAKKPEQYSDLYDLGCEAAAREYGLAVSTLQTLLNQAAEALKEAKDKTDTKWEGELLRCWDGFRATILEHPESDLPRQCFEMWFDDVNEKISEALAAIELYLTKEGE